MFPRLAAALCFFVAFLIAVPTVSSHAAGTVGAVSTNVKTGGRTYGVKYVKANLNQVRVKVGLAWGKVGRTEALCGIARRYNAKAAINGSFFDAYTDKTLKSPYHTLIIGGELVHYGKVGTVLGFSAGNAPRMGRLPLKIEGSLDGSYRYPNNWYAYNLNHYPDSSTTVTIYTPMWGTSTNVPGGPQITVRSGKVVKIGSGSQPIPADGYVILFKGKESKLSQRFRVGRRCSYRIVKPDGSDLGAWKQVKEAMGCGPRLLTDGKITLDAGSEGFSSPKVLRQASSRSMVGVTAGGSLLFVTSSGTMRQMADVMKALGAHQAMAMDGGASSGLWANGNYLTPPSRNVSNALLVLGK